MEVGIKNYMEDMVLARLPSVMGSMDVCQCERCKLDVLAYVLNNMPPKYVVTVKGTMYAKLALLQSQFDVDIITHITRGVALVSANPRHD